MYGGLILLGIHDRCTPGLAAMVSAWSALLSSFEEVRQVLLEQGVILGVKVVTSLRKPMPQQVLADPRGQASYSYPKHIGCDCTFRVKSPQQNR